MESQNKSIKLGSVAKKILILLGTGLVLGLTARPDQYFRLIESAQREWGKVSKRRLREVIRKLYEAKLIDSKDNIDGTTTIILNAEGSRKVLTFNLDKLKLKKFDKWDGFWRIVIFDIPENYKKARDAFARKLLHLGFKSMQRSVFIYPYECNDEIEFIVELFLIKPFVRIILAKELDIDLEMRDRFNL